MKITFYKIFKSSAVLLVCFLPYMAFTQGAAINTTGTPANASAILDVSSSSAGMLIPRMTKNQRNSINSPAEGLFIYQTDDTTGFWYHSSGLWKLMGSGSGGSIANGTAIGNTLYWDGSQWVESSNIYNAGGSVGINTNNPENSAYLDIFGTQKGFLIPRLSTFERDNNIQNPAIGLQIINTTTNCLEIYFQPVWQSVYCGCSPPDAPITGTHKSFTTSITWNWNSVPNVLGYKCNTVNDFSSAMDMGLNTSYVQHNLLCNSNYSLYVWSYQEFCISNQTVLTATTSNCPLPCVWNSSNTFTITHNAGSVAPVTKTNLIYGQTQTNLSGSSKCWITQNLGADNQADSLNDISEASAGWYWQFNRKQGYKHDGVTRTPNTTWLTNINESSNWSSSNDPCTIELGSGWRIPTYSEWGNVISNWSNIFDSYNSVLKLHAAGGLNYYNGTSELRGNQGYYYCSTQYDATIGQYVYINNNYAGLTTNHKSDAKPIRCLRD